MKTTFKKEPHFENGSSFWIYFENEDMPQGTLDPLLVLVENAEENSL